MGCPHFAWSENSLFSRCRVISAQYSYYSWDSNQFTYLGMVTNLHFLDIFGSICLIFKKFWSFLGHFLTFSNRNYQWVFGKQIRWPDGQIMVYLGILVTRNLISCQTISRIFTALQIGHIFLKFPLFLAELSIKLCKLG